MKLFRRLWKYVIPYRPSVIVALVSMFTVALTTGALITLIRPLFDEVLSEDKATQITVVRNADGSVTAQQPAQALPAGAEKIATVDAPVAGEGDDRARNALVGMILKRDQPEGQRGAVINTIDRATKRARDWWTENEDRRWIYVLAALFATFVVRAISAFFSEYSFQKVGLSTVRDMRNALYESIIRQSNRFFSRKSTGELVSRIVSDVEQIQAAVSIRVGDLLQESLTLIVISVVILLMNAELAVFTFIIAPLIAYPVVQFGKRLRKATRVSQERMAGIATILEETIKGVRIVKAFAMEPFEIRRFREATARHLSINLHAQKIQALTSPVMELLAGVCMVLLFAYAAVRIRAGGLTLGQFMSFLLALAGMYAPIKRLNKVNLAMNTALSAAERVFSMLDEPNDVVEKSDAVRLSSIGTGIRYDDVWFRYDEDRWVLRGVSFDVQPGKMVALVGGSGSGKSTLVNLLPRFWDVEKGHVKIDGTDVRDMTLESLRSALGVVTQETILFNDSVRNNIAYGRSDISDEQIREAAAAANALEFIERLPGGLDSMVGEGGVLLSGGQRQRLAIARALLKNPPILILDEATSALDTESERLVQQALANLMQGRTTLVIAHRLSTVRRADTILVLDRGEIAERGTHEELIARGGLYNRLYELQFDETDIGAHEQP